MPIAVAVKMVVIMKSGVILLDMTSWSLGSWAGSTSLRNWRGVRFDGLIQRVYAKNMSRLACTARRLSAKGLDRKVSSEMKRQLTVHL